MKKAMYVTSFLVALICAMILLSPAVAGAEHYLILTDYVVEAGYFEGEPALLVTYKWQNTYQCFAWNKLWIEPWRPIWIILTDDGRCYDAGYCEETRSINELP